MVRRLFDRQRPRCIVIGLDGVGYRSLAPVLPSVMPALAEIAGGGSLLPVRSPLPAVSAVGWASFTTASNPGRHGVFGFTHPRDDNYELHFASSADLRMPTLWDRAAIDGLRSLVVNMPGTYPARPISGTLVAGFVAPNLRRACHPAALADRLAEWGYVVDVDVRLAERDEDAFYAALDQAVERRIDVMRRLLGEERWSLAVLTFTEPDRLLHLRFPVLTGDTPEAVVYRRILGRIDDFVGQLTSAHADTPVIVVSDHGFGPLGRYLNLNAWLRDAGYLVADDYAAIDERTRAFALDPGRIYVNTAGRFARGAVPRDQARALADEIGAALLDARDDQGERPVTAAIPRSEAYSGPHTERGPNIVCLPGPGYDLKASMRLPTYSEALDLRGTHNHDDAVALLSRPVRVGAGQESGGADLHDVGATVLSTLGLHADDVDGRSLL